MSSNSSSGLYNAAWRWHFWAGLLAGPIVVMLAITGSVYLFKPQYESWRHKDLLMVPAGRDAVALDDQLNAAVAYAPYDWKPQTIQPPAGDGHSTMVQFQDAAGGLMSVFVDPGSLEILGTRDEGQTLMATIKLIHGSLLLGDWGDRVVELGASWCFALLVTGWYLWWPRPFRIRGFLLPRFGSGKRNLLIDMHAVPMVWFSGFALFLLASGIPWSGVGGTWFREVGRFLGEWQPTETRASAHRSDLLGGWSPYLDEKELAERVEAVRSNPEDAEVLASKISLERVSEIAAEQNVRDSFAIALPQGPEGVYSILSDRNKAFTRAYVHIDQYSGNVLADVRFKDFGLMAKFFSFGIIAHEGQLFGWLNQLLGLLTCLILVGTFVTGIIMWWSRRPAGGFGAPRANTRFPKKLLGLLVISGMLFPLLAASLVVIYLVDRLAPAITGSNASYSTERDR